MENLQMCKKEKYEKHRNILVSFFASAMLVILNSQKLSLRTSSRCRRNFLLLFYKVTLYLSCRGFLKLAVNEVNLSYMLK